MEVYREAEMDIIFFTDEDVITTSPQQGETEIDCLGADE